MNHESNAVAATLSPVSGWVLHSGGRQFGPLSDDELRSFFSSGVVRQGDSLKHAELDLSETASQAAARLQVAPPAASAPPPPELPVRLLAVRRQEGHAVRTTLLALVLLVVAGFYFSSPRNPLRDSIDSLTGKSWVAEANRLEDAQNWRAARAHAERWIASDPSANAWLYEGRALVQLQLEAEAVQAFRKGLALSPDDEILLSNLGQLQFDLHQYDESAQTLKRALAHNPGAAGAWYGLGRAYSKQSRHDDALAAFQSAARLRPNDSGSWSEIGHEYYQLGRMHEAIDPLEKAIALEPGFRRPKQILDAVRDSIAGRPSHVPIEAASTTARASAAGLPSSTSATAPATAAPPAPPAVAAQMTGNARTTEAGKDPRVTEARRLEALKDWPAARLHAQRWTQAEPKSALAWQYLARAQQELGEYNEAVRGFARASELAPGHFWIAANFGGLYYRMRDFENAEAEYRRAIAINPRSADAHSWLADDLLVQNQTREALAAWEEAARLEPGNYARWNELAYQHYKQGNMKQAAEAADRGYAVNPKNGYAKGLAEWVRSH